MKNELKRRATSLLLLIAVLLPILVLPAQAASLPSISSSKYISAYTLATSGKVYVYSDSGLTKRTGGYIACSTDECRIIAVSGEAVRVSYPTSAGRRTAWAPASAFAIASLSGDLTQVTATGKITTYKRASGGTTYGSVYKGDVVYILGSRNGRTQLVYPAGARYKLAFVSDADAAKYLPTSTPAPNNNNNNNNNNNGYLTINGTFTITTALDTRLALDVENNSHKSGAMSQIYWLSDGNLAQVFEIRHMGNGWHKIIHKDSGLALDVMGGVGVSTNGTWWYDASDANNKAQLWKIIKAPNGGYYFRSALGDLYLNVKWGNASPNTPVFIYTHDGTASMTWHLNSVSTTNTNNNTNNNADTWQWPMTSAYVCGNDWNEYYKERPSRPYHVGVDIASRDGDTRVMAAAEGTVAKTGWNSANGNYVVLKHTLSGKTVYSFYAHLSKITCSEGSSVTKGTQIGVMGNSGSGSDGAHLHFAVVDQLWRGSYYGYVTKFSGDKVRYDGVNYYNPHYVVSKDALPS